MSATPPVEPGNPPRLGFLLSGSGRTLQNMAAFLSERPDLAEIVLVISNRRDALGLERARELGIATQVLPCRNRAESEQIFASLDAAGADFALCGGFLQLLHVPPGWERRVLNIHPSLIPKYSGKGFYGDHVHRAVLAAGETESGCTVHFVDNIYDHGAILLQETVPVLPDDTPASLAQRVFDAECRAFPQALERLTRGLVRWLPDGTIDRTPTESLE